MKDMIHMTAWWFVRRRQKRHAKSIPTLITGTTVRLGQAVQIMWRWNFLVLQKRVLQDRMLFWQALTQDNGENCD